MTKLSICIATFGRGEFIAETLESIVPQLTADVELVIVEGHSPDHTESVVREYSSQNEWIRYYREPVNSGVDADYNKAVLYARGEYCWLFTDDDLLMPSSVARVLDVLTEKPDLLVVDAAVMDVTMSRTLRPRRMKFTGLRRYGVEQSDDVMKDLGEATSFIGAVIIRRDVWIARDHESFDGTVFAHVGIIFQLPKLGSVIGLGECLIAIRYGNAMWAPRRFEIWAFKWPRLVWGFEGYSDAAKSVLGSQFPWRSFKILFSFRARGAYSYRVYRQYFDGEKIGIWRLPMWAIAILPGRLAHVVGTSYLGITGTLGDSGGYELLRNSVFTNSLSRCIARFLSKDPVPDSLANESGLR